MNKKQKYASRGCTLCNPEYVKNQQNEGLHDMQPLPEKNI